MTESETEREYRLGKWLVREDWWLWLLFALVYSYVVWRRIRSGLDS